MMKTTTNDHQLSSILLFQAGYIILLVYLATVSFKDLGICNYNYHSSFKVGMACGNPKDSIFTQYLLIISIMILTTQLKLASSFHIVARRPVVSFLSSKRFGQASTFSSASGSRYRKQASSVCQMTIADTPLGTDEGAKLLDGLDVYSVPAKEDQHPLTVYGLHSSEPSPDDNILLLLHGRTWSSVPVYHLLGGPAHEKEGKESRSLMEGLHQRKIQTYAMDFRGFGGTPHDEENCVTPNRCVEDVETVLQWIVERHGLPEDEFPALFGWSQGALVAQLVAQKPNPSMSKVILYGSIYDPMVRYPREPLFIQNRVNTTNVENTWDGAIEDFTIEGTIPPEAAQEFADAALVSDPIKCQWKQLHQFNNCDPGRVHVPTLVVAGDQDPYAPLHVQQELFYNLARGSDRTWSILSDADHAVHLLEGRPRFMNIVKSFLRNNKRSDQERI